MATEKTQTTPATKEAGAQELELNVESSRYRKNEQQRMSDGMVP